ncbi:MAG: helix-turn-helix domain-containing protein [Bacteroidetes bacterium]|nr:helix-turn-helix domain-containing protein [Bacteroidota bacterium]
MQENKLKEILSVEGITQAELSRECGLSESSIYNFKTNKRQPNEISKVKITNAINTLTKKNKNYTVVFVFPE